MGYSGSDSAQKVRSIRLLLLLSIHQIYQKTAALGPCRVRSMRAPAIALSHLLHELNSAQLHDRPVGRCTLVLSKVLTGRKKKSRWGPQMRPHGSRGRGGNLGHRVEEHGRAFAGQFLEAPRVDHERADDFASSARHEPPSSPTRHGTRRSGRTHSITGP